MLTHCHVITSIIDELESKTAWVDVAVTPEKESTKDWLG
jgi:hypothetical protein